MHLLVALAASSTNASPIGSVLIWSGILIALLLVAFAGYSYLKRWMNSSDEPVKVGFTLSDLRELHRQGKMSDQEYEMTRANMLKAAKRAAERLPEVLPRRGRDGKAKD